MPHDRPRWLSSTTAPLYESQLADLPVRLTTSFLSGTIMRMDIIFRAAAVIFVGLMVAARGEDDPRVVAVLAADDTRIAAMTAADPVALAPLLSPDLRYSHSNGAVDTKASLLELIGGKATRYISYRPVERGVRFASPEIALEHGRAELVLEKDGKQTEATFLFLAVWRFEDGAWRFLEWQSARPPSPLAPASDRHGPAGR